MKLKKELPLIFIILFPVLYLSVIWKDLPAKVPLHWNIKGEIDRYGSKNELWWIILLMPLMIYLVFLLVPLIDPKNKIKNMGRKYFQLKFVMTAFMAALSMFIIYSVSNASMGHANFVLQLIGILYMIFGNYFKTIQPNYFIGIRTPWTLENDEIWKKTHVLGGKLWLTGGILIVISGLFIFKTIFLTVFIIVSIVISLIPVIYSFILYKQNKHNK